MSCERLCPRCGGLIPDTPLKAGQVRSYCSKDCREAMKDRRYRARRRKRDGLKRPSPSLPAWTSFRSASVWQTNLNVAEAEADQAQARQLIAAGFVAYENRAGFVRDVAMPRKPRNAGRVFAVR